MSRRKCMQKRNDSRKQIFSQNEELKAIVNHVRNVGTLDGFCFPQPVVRRLPTKHSTSVSLLFAQFPIQCTTKKYGGRTIVQTIPEYFLSIRHISHCCASNCVTLSHKGIIIIIITRPKPARPSVPLTSRLRRSARK